KHHRCGNKLTDIQGALRIAALFYTHKEGTQYRGDDTRSRQYERQQHGRQAVKIVRPLRIAHKSCTQYHRTDNRSYIGLEKVGSHTGHIAHIITHIVGNGSGIEWVIFGDARFYFTYKVVANIGGFCVNAAAYTGKKGN